MTLNHLKSSFLFRLLLVLALALSLACSASAESYEAETMRLLRHEGTVEIFDVRIRNTSDRERHISAYGYVEFSFHNIDIDNQNFQMSLYCAGSFMENGAAVCELHYEPDSFQFFAASFEPDGWEGVREAFIGDYRTERNPLGVARGALTGAAA